MKWADFLHVDKNLGKLNVDLIIIGWVCLKMGKTFQINGTLKSGAPHKWFDESSRLIQWFLHCDKDRIIFVLTTSLLCIFNICWVSTAVVLVKDDVLFLVSTEKVFELAFPKCFFNKSLIKCGKIVSCRKNMENDKKPRCSSCIAIEPHNFKILALLLYGYHTSQLTNIAIPAIDFSPYNFKLLPTC